MEYDARIQMNKTHLEGIIEQITSWHCGRLKYNPHLWPTCVVPHPHLSQILVAGRGEISTLQFQATGVLVGLAQANA